MQNAYGDTSTNYVSCMYVYAYVHIVYVCELLRTLNQISFRLRRRSKVQVPGFLGKSSWIYHFESQSEPHQFGFVDSGLDPRLMKNCVSGILELDES